MATFGFHIIDVTYKVLNGTPTVFLYGRSETGKQCCVLVEYLPWFYALNVDQLKEQIKNLHTTDANVINVTEVERTLNEKPVKAWTIAVSQPSGIPELSKTVRDLGGKTYEYDIPFTRRFLFDAKLAPFSRVHVTGEEIVSLSKVPVIKASSIRQGDETTLPPKALAIDIEAYPVMPINYDEHPILMVAFKGDNYEKVITWKKCSSAPTYVEFVESEEEMLKRTIQTIEEYSPDILTGYYSDGFDLPYLVKRCKKYDLSFDLGLDKSEVQITKTGETKARITGIAHVDMLRVVKRLVGRTLKSESFKLDDVAKELLGESKHEVSWDALREAWDKHPELLGPFFEYNLQDARLTYSLFAKFAPTLVELVKIVGLPIAEISRMSFSQLVEVLLLRNASFRGEIAPNKPSTYEEQSREEKRFVGALVHEPTPGLYEGIAVFDYRSLYPSIIASHNISLGTLQCDCCATNVPGLPYHYCQKKKGFISTVIDDLISRRARVKLLLKESPDDIFLKARSDILKLLANSFYGYLGFAPARWYSFECGQATTAYGRHYITTTIEQARKNGFEVLYSDSLHPDRKIVVQDPTGNVTFVPIGSFVDSILEKKRSLKGYKTLSYNGKKLVFSNIKSVIRHPYSSKKKGELLEFVTTHGKTVVTPQHSVYTYKKRIELVDSRSLNIGDYLISCTNVPIISAGVREGNIIDVASLSWGEYTPHMFLYADCVLSSNSRGVCIHCKKEYASLSSHKYAKHKSKKVPLSHRGSVDFLWIGGKHGKCGRIPRFWKVTKDLAWLFGYFAAEGSASEHSTIHKKAMISFGSQDKSVIEKVKRIMEWYLQDDLSIITDFDTRTQRNMYYYRVQRLPIVPLFIHGFGLGKLSAGKKVPSIILTAESVLRDAFLSGYLEGDGEKYSNKRYTTKFERMSTKSTDLAVGLQYLFKSAIHSTKNGFHKIIEHVGWSYRKDKLGVVNLRFQAVKEKEYENFCLARIKEIHPLHYEGFVYDIEVESSHNFVDAEGLLLVHNTDSIMLVLRDKTEADALKFVESINKELPGVMEIDYEGYYPSGIFVSVKAGTGGAKKKYALLDSKGKIKVKGFETVRRNWSPVAKKLQRELFDIILKEKNIPKAVERVRSAITSLRSNSLPLEDVTLYTQLQKPIDQYENVGPHVAAAQRMKDQGQTITVGMNLHYLIVKGKDSKGKEKTTKIRDRVRLLNEVTQQDYDGEYYVQHQILPGVDRIFAVLGVTEEDILRDNKQKTLGNF